MTTALKPIPRLLNAAGGSGGGFLANMGIKLPFGMSNVSSNTPDPNPNFPSKTQLEPKNNNSKVDANGNPVADVNTDPNNNADPNKGTQGSQLDNFKDIFTIPVDKDGKQIVATDPFATPITNLDPAKLKEAASQMNFAAGMNAESVAKAMQDPAALLALINQVGQNAFAAALTANTGIVERSINENNSRFEAALPDRIRNTQIAQTASKHPALSHPAAAPMVAALKTQIANTNPHLTPEQVASKAEGYVIAMASDINNVNTQEEQQRTRSSSKEVDWTALLGGQ